MSDKKQHNSKDTNEKMERRYDDGHKHKHDKTHLEFRAHEKSHPGTEHGGDPEADKRNLKDGKRRDHKKHTREHHKTSE